MNTTNAHVFLSSYYYYLLVKIIKYACIKLSFSYAKIDIIQAKNMVKLALRLL